MNAVPARLEAVFIATDDTTTLSDAVADGLGCAPAGTADELVQVPCEQVFVALEPAAGDVPGGSVTLWWRVDDAPAAAARFARHGWSMVPERTSDPREPGETTAAVRSPEGLVLGFISG